MRALAVLVVCLGTVLAVLNWSLKVGIRASEGVFALWRTLCERAVASRSGRAPGGGEAAGNVCAEVPPRAGTAGRMTGLAVQASFYLFGLWMVAVGSYYLWRGRWLSSPLVILIACFWVAMLAALPPLLTAAKKGSGLES